jgi:hypothetical protein
MEHALPITYLLEQRHAHGGIYLNDEAANVLLWLADEL